MFSGVPRPEENRCLLSGSTFPAILLSRSLIRAPAGLLHFFSIAVLKTIYKSLQEGEFDGFDFVIKLKLEEIDTRWNLRCRIKKLEGVMIGYDGGMKGFD